MTHLFKRAFNKFLKPFGYHIAKSIIYHQEPSTDSMEAGLKRISVHFTPKTVIDIGAAAGTWTEKCLPIWKDAQYLLFEPLEERVADINALKERNSQTKITHVQAAAGKEKVKISFTVSDDLDGSGIYGHGKLREVDLLSVDDVMVENGSKAPYLLKLDTHGFELPIFEGATEVLKQTGLIIVEVYGFYVAPKSFLFWQVCQYLDSKGFRLFDIVDTMRRPRDQAFWQCDAYFIPKSSFIYDFDTYN